MTISLKKGGKIKLSKDGLGGNTSLKNLLVGLGWDTNQFDTGADFDLDASAFLCGANGRCRNEKDFVFYGNLQHESGAVTHSGDNKVGGEGDEEGDEEEIQVDLSKVPDFCEKIAFTVTIYDAPGRRQNFGQVSNAYIRVVDRDTNKELVRFDLGEDYSIETAVVAAEIYKKDGNWNFNAIGSGFQGGLAALCRHYGLDAEAE